MLQLPFFHQSPKEDASVKTWRHIEYGLLALLLLCKLWLFWRRFGQSIGYDAGALYETMNALHWTGLNLGVRELFYSYHPPLAFLLGKLLMLTGLTDVHAAQVVSFCASVGSFLLLRSTLRALSLLTRPAAIAFLYIASAIPMQLFLQGSANLDVLMLFWGTLVLRASVGCLWMNGPWTKRKWLWLTMLALALAAGMMTKISCLLLFAIPPLVAFFSPLRIGWKTVGIALAACAVSGALVFPYYYGRFYRSEGTFLPINSSWMAAQEIADKHARMRADPLRAARDIILLPSPIHLTRGVAYRDYDTLRLFDTWRDFWIREDYFLGRMGTFERIVAVFYLFAATILCIHGLLLFLLHPDTKDLLWRRFGFVVLGISAVYVLSGIRVLFLLPAFGSSKGVYIAPAMWGVAYLLVEALTRLQRAPFREAQSSQLQAVALTAMLATFIVVNHAVPIY